MSDKFIPGYAEAFSRIQDVTGCETQQELAAFFGVRQSSISDAKKRKRIPDGWLLAALRKLGANPEWILHGGDIKYLAPADSAQSMPHVVRVTEVRPPERRSAQELVNELVRRALRENDSAAIQKEVADSWLPLRNTTGNKA